MNIVSIFNDVIGPVMRGPSSSHCAAALRIGRLARDLMDGEISEVLVEFDRAGSLPTTHESQGSDMGLFGGLLGWEADDERLPDSAQALAEAGSSCASKPSMWAIRIRTRIAHAAQRTRNAHAHRHLHRRRHDGGAEHRRRAAAHGRRVSRDADLAADKVMQTLLSALWASQRQRSVCITHDLGDRVQLIQVKAARRLSHPTRFSGYLVKRLSPVLPVPSRKNIRRALHELRGHAGARRSSKHAALAARHRL
jgi:hypothetical protein